MTTAAAPQPQGQDASPPPPALVPQTSIPPAEPQQPPAIATTPTPAPPVTPAQVAPSNPPAVTLTEQEIAAGVTADDQHVLIPAASYRTILQAAGEAARREYEATMQDRLTRIGFADLSDLLQQVETEIATLSQGSTMTTTAAPPATQPASATPAAAITQPAGAAPQPTPPLTAAPPVIPGAQPTPAQIAAAAADDPANDRRLPENIRKRVAQFRDQMRSRAEAAEAQAQTHQTRVTALETELQAARAAEAMKIQMVQAGVKEIEFCWHQLSNELARLKADPSPEAKEKLKTFDVAAWAAELRKTKPYLFGEQVVPATSPGPGTPAGAAPTPAAVAGAVTGAGQFDARTADPKAFKKRMDELGIRYTGSGSPIQGR